METTPELVIFMIVGAVAILAAVMMLISENAVHSALFLILNFACVAFLYLMLNAAFLFLVQIAVYAGAIMVLFMFVIMLMGADKTAPDPKPRYSWLTPVAVVLTVIFLLTAGVGIMEAEISASETEPPSPIVRVVNASSAYPHISVYADGELIAEEVAEFEHSEFTELAVGEHEITVVPEGGEPIEISLTHINDPYAGMGLVEGITARFEDRENPQAETLEFVEPRLTLDGGEALTLIFAPLPNGGFGFVPVEQNLFSFGNDKMVRWQVVHAASGYEAVDFADITELSDAPMLLDENITFGETSNLIVSHADDFIHAIYEHGAVAEAGADIDASDVDTLADFESQEFAPDTSTLYVLARPRRAGVGDQPPFAMQITTDNLPAFGSPEAIGQALFTNYMLPFQLIALLLLVAMIGAIVMTRDAEDLTSPATPQESGRPRYPRRLANVAGMPTVDEEVGK